MTTTTIPDLTDTDQLRDAIANAVAHGRAQADMRRQRQPVDVDNVITNTLWPLITRVGQQWAAEARHVTTEQVAAAIAQMPGDHDDDETTYITEVLAALGIEVSR